MNGKRKETMIIIFAGAVPVVWVALLLAPYWTESLVSLVPHIGEVFADPFHIRWTDHSLRAVFLFLFAYALVIGIHMSMKKNYRRGEEHGSARWGDISDLNRRYRQFPGNMNKILTQHVRIGFDGHKHRRNLNVLVIGGSGAGKTRFYVKPNVMQANCSMVILDPNGETNYSHFFITFFQRREMQ